MKNKALQIYKNIQEYCDKYNIPIENLIDILEDQKVLPMIRGKATEFVATVFLKRILPSLDFVERAAKKLKDHPPQWKRILLNQLKREKNKKILIEATASQYLEYLTYLSQQKTSL